MKTKRPSPTRAGRVRRAPRPAAAPAALLAAALQCQSEGVFIAEHRAQADGLKIVFANARFCAMTGYSAAELQTRRHGFLHADKADLERLRRWAAKAAPSKVFAGEGDLIRKNGGTIYAAWSFSPVTDARGRVTHIVATYRDTTAKRDLEEALLHAQRLDAVGRLAGGVAHDFNNLISVINGYCQIVAEKIGDNPALRRDIEEIHKAGQKAATLTRQLLAFGRRQPMDPRIIPLSQLVQENAEILTRVLGNAGRLELKLAADAGQVRADPDQLQQVLLNLTLNARDALRDHGCVTISTARHEIKTGRHHRPSDIPPGQYVVLSVADNGTGMDADTQSHLFEPFFTTKEPGKGSGLGLALVYGVVQQSNGFIRVHSALLVGSTFEIYLPLVAGPAEPVTARPLPMLTPTRGHETVLLVESDAVVGKMVSGMLTSDGYQVMTAHDAVQALQLARTLGQPPHILIASIGEQEGCDQLVQALRERNPNLCVLCTAPCEQICPSACMTAARRLCLPKPFALSELLKATRQLLDGGA
ncbi:MAG: PAS domain S-box protein [Opitutae bacterium]|nr:PAS domain S-box protein [Opitutae bacterium]